MQNFARFQAGFLGSDDFNGIAKITVDLFDFHDFIYFFGIPRFVENLRGDSLTFG